MLRRFAIALCAVVVVTGCSSLPKPKELAGGVKSVAFVQHGVEPLQYRIGAVDGTTSWAQGAPTFTPGSNASLDVGVAAAANLVNIIGKKIAEDAMKDDPDYYIRLFMKMVGERKMTNEIAPAVLPELAAVWGFTYNKEKLQVIPNGTPLINAQGMFNGTDPGADLVLAYGIDYMMLSERPQMSVLFKAVATAGMYSRPVTPFIYGTMNAFKRNEKGELRHAWTLRCPDIYHLNSDVYEQWNQLKEAPEKASPLFDNAIPIAIDSCKKMLKHANG